MPRSLGPLRLFTKAVEGLDPEDNLRNQDPREPGSPVERLFYWAYERWPWIAIAAGTVSATVGGAYVNFAENAEKATKSPPGIALWVGCLLLVLGTIASWVRTESIRRLRKDNWRLRRLLRDGASAYFAMFENNLAILARNLGFGDSERISVYRQHGELFVMLSRYSDSPIFTNRGRGIQPIQQGCVGEAWCNGESIVLDLPDPKKDLESYLSAAAQRNVPREVAERFAMKSRAYAAFRLRDDKTNRQVAVVVFESTKPHGLQPDRLRSMMIGSEGEQLVEMIRQWQHSEPSPEIATKAGF